MREVVLQATIVVLVEAMAHGDWVIASPQQW
jgi:hypothetical protein